MRVLGLALRDPTYLTGRRPSSKCANEVGTDAALNQLDTTTANANPYGETGVPPRDRGCAGSGVYTIRWDSISTRRLKGQDKCSR